MPIHQLQHPPRRPIIRNRIRRGPQTIEGIPALCVRLELPSEIMLNLARILLFIQPIRGSLPHFNRRAGQRLLRGEIDYSPVHEGHLPVDGLGEDYVCAVLAVGRVGAEEWA